MPSARLWLSPSHGENRGSSPLGSANNINDLHFEKIPVSQVLRCRLTNHDDNLAVGLDLNTTLNAGGYPAWIARVTSRFLKVQGPRIAILSMKKKPPFADGQLVQCC